MGVVELNREALGVGAADRAAGCGRGRWTVICKLLLLHLPNPQPASRPAPPTPAPQCVEVALNVAPYQYDPKEAARASNPDRRRKWLIPLVLAAQVGLRLGLCCRPARGRGSVHAAWRGCVQASGARARCASRRDSQQFRGPSSSAAARPQTSPRNPPPPLLQVALKLLLDRVTDEDGCRGDSNGPFDARTRKERREELKREKVGLAGGWAGGSCMQSSGARLPGLREPCPTGRLPGSIGWTRPDPSAPLPVCPAPPATLPQEEQRQKKERRKARAAGSQPATYYAGDTESEGEDDF